MKIQIELSPEENKIVEIYKLVNDLRTKEEAIKLMVQHFKVEIRPEKIGPKEYFK
jgi:hypothetical protein